VAVAEVGPAVHDAHGAYGSDHGVLMGPKGPVLSGLAGEGFAGRHSASKADRRRISM
jgi:hypothetical protein